MGGTNLELMEVGAEVWGVAFCHLNWLRKAEHSHKEGKSEILLLYVVNIGILKAQISNLFTW